MKGIDFKNVTIPEDNKKGISGSFDPIAFKILDFIQFLRRGAFIIT